MFMLVQSLDARGENKSIATTLTNTGVGRIADEPTLAALINPTVQMSIDEPTLAALINLTMHSQRERN